jgi:hypothetical protein
MKRNIVNEIISIRERSEFNSRYDFTFRLEDIERAFSENLDYNGDFNDELLKYIPIATVACFESFFRSAIKEIIDFGKPFLDNVGKFNQAKNVKFDFEIINAFRAKEVTVGEFVSHILPCNNYEDIDSNLSILANINFTTSLKDFKRESMYQKLNESTKLFSENSDKIIADIKRTFELRHIFCHEFATNLKIDKDEIIKCYTSSKIFLNHTNQFIWHLLYPNAPQTQSAMNIAASKQFEKLESELAELIITIKETVNQNEVRGFDNELFDASMEQWKRYRKSVAELEANKFREGTIFSMILSNSLSSTTQKQITSLKEQYEYELRKYASR